MEKKGKGPGAAVRDHALRPMSVCLIALALLTWPGVTARAQGTNREVATASVSGTVLDPTAAAVAGSQVSLTLKGGTRLQTVTSGANGEFTFSRVPPGSYVIVVEAAGFATFTTSELTITAADVLRLPPITLAIADVTASIVVKPTELVAAEQIKAQEKQRVFGVVPNFYVSYVPDAAPMTSRQKLSLALRDTLDWTTFANVSVVAAVEQATNAYAGYGDGASGYAKRWAAAFATERSNDVLTHYVFASLFHQDPRYFYQGTGTRRSRIYHALSSAFVARSDSGRSMPNYAYLFGNIGAAALSNAYYPRADRGVRLTLTNVALALAGRAGQGLMQEFVSKRITRNVPRSGSPQVP